MTLVLGVIGLRGGVGRRSLADVRAAEADPVAPVEPLAAIDSLPGPTSVTGAQEARAASALPSVVGRKR
jgi:hypothetical protein